MLKLVQIFYLSNERSQHNENIEILPGYLN